jgi:hypothetical protein
MAEKLTRYEMGEIGKLHDAFSYGYKAVSRDYLTQQLARLGLPSRVSRLNLAQRIKEIERERFN